MDVVETVSEMVNYSIRMETTLVHYGEQDAACAWFIQSLTDEMARSVALKVEHVREWS
jgi:hypothetical protein